MYSTDFSLTSISAVNCSGTRGHTLEFKADTGALLEDFKAPIKTYSRGYPQVTALGCSFTSASGTVTGAAV